MMPDDPFDDDGDARVLATVMLLLAFLLLAGCTNAAPPSEACGPWRPILLGAGDTLTSPTERQIVSHNETGRRLCRW